MTPHKQAMGTWARDFHVSQSRNRNLLQSAIQFTTRPLRCCISRTHGGPHHVMEPVPLLATGRDVHSPRLRDMR